MRIGMVTKEWPPAVYGGAGVHVVQLSAALRTVSGIKVDVHCFGGPRNDGAFGYETPPEFASVPGTFSPTTAAGAAAFGSIV